MGGEGSIGGCYSQVCEGACDVFLSVIYEVGKMGDDGGLREIARNVYWGGDGHWDWSGGGNRRCCARWSIKVRNMVTISSSAPDQLSCAVFLPQLDKDQALVPACIQVVVGHNLVLRQEGGQV